jgi:type I restriction enzyme S subunit
MSFPRYPEYKDSGVEWLGAVPRHWAVKRIKTLTARIASGKTPLGGSEVYVDEGITFLRSQNVYDEGLRLDDVAFISEAVDEAMAVSRVIVGDILLNITGASIGRSCVVPDGFSPANVNQHVCVIRATSPSPFLGWALKSAPIKSQIDHAQNGAAREGLNFDQIGRMVTTLPSEQEQTQIASFLDRETAKIDALVAEQRRLMALLKDELNSLVLSSFNLVTTQQIRLAHAVDLVTRPVAQSEGELYTPLGLYNRGRGLFHKDPREMADMGDSDFFWIEDGDLIISGQFAWEGSVALAGTEESGCVVSHRYPVLRGKNGVALTEYLFALLCTDHGDFLLNESSWGAAGRNRPLNIGLLLKEKVPVPTMETQVKVAQAVRNRKMLVEEIAKQTVLLQERRITLISAAVTGQIDVRGVAT